MILNLVTVLTPMGLDGLLIVELALVFYEEK